MLLSGLGYPGIYIVSATRKYTVSATANIHFTVTLGGVLAPKGAAGAAKVVSEEQNCCKGGYKGRDELEKACSRGTKDVQEEPRVSIVRISGFKMTSK